MERCAAPQHALTSRWPPLAALAKASDQFAVANAGWAAWLSKRLHTYERAGGWVGLQPGLQQHEHKYSVAGEEETRKEKS